ncbi:hypothetical protein SAMN05877809_103211 [Rhodobacter sp. JA431]|uniref:hypothetical protein n=1 Tax=Rhodobacter sp. JA431 TaxID=570013 RepID=UPI000BC92A0B|nr:hypothetical protein [Rhodobacter sp. JA431]SOC04562.1 hypothetical protein SAMN05877809_103211 [Rhodobacter sp. JA431]
MKGIGSSVLLCGLAAALSACMEAPSAPAPVTVTPPPVEVAEPPGTSPASAIPASSVAAEYAYVSAHFPGWQVQTQGLMMQPSGRAVDVLTLEKAGENRDLYFDISSFFVTGL